MKPLSTNNLSAWGYVGLFILFCLPYVGTPALIICALLVKNYDVRSFSRAILILTLLLWVAVIILSIVGIVNLSDFGFSTDDGVQAFNYVRGFLC